MLTTNCLHALSINKIRCCPCFHKNLYPTNCMNVRFKHGNKLLKQSYQVLSVSEDCGDNELRLAFVHLAKQYHPDSGSATADSTKFSEIESAYRIIQKDRNSRRDDRNSLPDVEDFDIQHTAPQHRHFLAYDTGIGTPSQRQKRYTFQRAQKAVDNVMEHRLKKIQAAERNTLVGKDKTRAKDIKTRYGIDRLVEDYIQEAMNKGEFSNLPGAGKPLKDRSSAQNPYVDFVTHKLNEILIDNGFTPEWIQLSKEIREETDELKNYLKMIRDKLGTVPLSPEDNSTWQKSLNNATTKVDNINRKINKYNLLVPILQNQMLYINLDKIAEQVLATLPDPARLEKSENSSQISMASSYSEPSLMDVIFSSIDWKKK